MKRKLKKILKSFKKIFCSHNWNTYTDDTYIECLKCGKINWQ